MADSITLGVALAIALCGSLVAAAFGFLFGLQFAASRSERRLKQAAGDGRRCLAEAIGSIDLAQRFCEAASDSTRLARTQALALAERQSRLADAIARLLSDSRKFSAAAATVEWQPGTLDPETGLPDRPGFDANVARLIAASAGPRGGVLLVAVDGVDRLRTRLGEPGVAEIRRTVARVVCRAGREQDLACTIGDGIYAVLLPDAEPDDALRQAAEVRRAFLGHPFRLGADGPEVFVTASYAFTPVLPGEDAPLVLDRADAALARARRWGRSRFHAYDPVENRIVPVAAPAATRAAALVPA